MSETEHLIFPGQPAPLGATWDGRGVNFALFSESAEKVELCLFEGPQHQTESSRFTLEDPTNHVWSAYLPEVRPGQAYGYRVYGPFDPQNGQRFNHNKLLLDPYARAFAGPLEWSDAMFGYDLQGGDVRDLSFSEDDSAPGMPKSLVIEPAFSWGNDRPPGTPWHQTIIYEAHVRGLTVRNPRVPAHLRGTYAGMAHHETIQYLVGLGVTAVELMPIHMFVDDRTLVEKGLRNYWGYNTLGFFAPDPRYAASRVPGQVVNEFKSMVRALHAAGLEVILDVVYNHTAEGNQFGPTLSFRGIDNRAYYRLVEGDARHYMDYTGTGNTLNVRHPRAMQLIMDSLRYWITEMHVDGFRFDLAATLARELHSVDRLSTFFDIIQQDPVISQVKLIAEPWDVGEGGYQVGNFPVLWTEWNGKYRDSIRRFWRGDPGQMAELGYRLTGSSDLYSHNGRRPYASINFITAHDGFTMRDLVSYNSKHNEANGEDNRDGTDDNNSWNSGAEGETTNRTILNFRRRQMRNFLTTLMISQGVPMVLHGDEVGRTQQGNNNTYCQDNEISWQSWHLEPWQKEMLEWTKRVIDFRQEHPVLRRSSFFQGRSVVAGEAKDVSWLRPDGVEMTDAEWPNDFARAIGMWLSGAAADLTDDRGQRIEDDTLVILMNSGNEEVPFTLPAPNPGTEWTLALDTARPGRLPGQRPFDRRTPYRLEGRSMAILVCPARHAAAHSGTSPAT